MAHFLKEENTSKDIIRYRYSGLTKQQLEDQLQEMFFASGYKEAGIVNNRTIYEKGDRTMRILFGAFVKYYKFVLLVEVDNEDVIANVMRATSGMSGGIIGRDQVTGEVIRLGQLMKQI